MPGFSGLRTCARASGEERGARWGVCGGARGNGERRSCQKALSGDTLGAWLPRSDFFEKLNMPKKISKLAARFFFFLPPLFVVHLSLHGRSVYFAQENEGPKRRCSACKAFMEGAKGNEGEELPSLLKQS